MERRKIRRRPWNGFEECCHAALPPNFDTDLADFVLGRVRGEEEKKLADAIDRGVEAVKLMVKGETDRAMNLYNG